MSENFKAEKSQFSNFWFWQLTTCQTIVSPVGLQADPQYPSPNCRHPLKGTGSCNSLSKPHGSCVTSLMDDHVNLLGVVGWLDDIVTSSPSRWRVTVSQFFSQSSWSWSTRPPSSTGRASAETCNNSCGRDTVNTRSRSFSRTKSLSTLKGALNHSGAVTMRTFFSRAG